MTENFIDAVLFDFGGVLAEEGFINGLRAIAAANGYEPESMVRKGFDLVHETGYVVGKSDEATFWRLLRERTGIRGSDEELRDEILSRFKLRMWMFEIVKDMRLSGVRAGILSDQTNWIDELNGRYDFFTRFDYVFTSYRMGTSKKNVLIFDEVLSVMGLEADRVLFVDDHSANCERARQRSLHTILYSSGEQFFKELLEYCPGLDGNFYNVFT